MRNSIYLPSLLLIITSLFSISIAKNGDKTGNGGGSWVCYNSNGDIKKMEFIDFFEATNQHGWKIRQYLGLNHNEILHNYLIRLQEIDRNLFIGLTPILSEFKNQMKVVSDAELNFVPDMNAIIRPERSWCKKGQILPQTIANYTDENILYLDLDRFNNKNFTSTMRAGLLLHEILYKYFRIKYQDQDSTRTRKLVGLIASTLDIKKVRYEYRYIQ